jgi:hypothetical protein
MTVARPPEGAEVPIRSRFDRALISVHPWFPWLSVTMQLRTGDSRGNRELSRELVGIRPNRATSPFGACALSRPKALSFVLQHLLTLFPPVELHGYG